MGCDIHAFAEIKVKGKWLNYSALDIDRNYGLFAKMANVRNADGYNITPISEPRGLPEDASEVVRLESDGWDTDGHSHSWLSYNEIEQLREWIRAHISESPFTIVLDLPYKITDPSEYKFIEDVRLVFWFDN